MKRREFSLAATAAVTLAATGCGGGGGDSSTGGAGGLTLTNGQTGLSPNNAELATGVNTTGLPMGTNLSGMEWAKPGLRYGRSTMPNMNFTVPRAADIAYLAANGFDKNRLPIQWELLQPMLHDTPANAQARAVIGEPGAFHAGYEAYITAVLDAHANVGSKCIIDLHNYCRYQDFKYQSDGSVAGLVQPAEPLLRPYTSDGSQVQERIFALAPGATLTQANFTDFWSRAARRWQGHPGLGGYGLMNEPHDLPVPGGTTTSYGGEDLTIWPAFAKAAIAAIRNIDSATPIYLAGNSWQSAMSLATDNPGWPLQGGNLIYDVHMYLDAFSNGWAFDFDTEVGKNFVAGIGGGASINAETGVARLRMATNWARQHGVKLALTEVGMPIDDPRWEDMFRRAMAHAREEGVEVYSWMGGNHWPARNYAINHVPGWHQNQTLEPTVAGPMKASAGIARAALFDDGPGYAPAGSAVTITVYARGNLASPVSITVSSSNGGTLSKSVLTIPAGPNGQDSYTYTSEANRVTTLTYSGAAQVPPPRKVYSLSDPVAYAATSLEDAARAIIARYDACKWEMADGHTDYMRGAPSGDGQPMRAISDSGYGSSPGNAMEMCNWINKEMGPAGDMSVPVTRVVNGRKCADHSAPGTFGFWCKKSGETPGVQANPKNRVPYNIEDAHFTIAAVSMPGAANGLVFQASKTEDAHTAELSFESGRPQAYWLDSSGQAVQLSSATALGANTPGVVAMTCAPGAQSLRLNSAVVGSSYASLAPSSFTQMLIGWGYRNYYPGENFGGHIFAVISGKGAPTPQELAVMERYLATTAGISI